MKITMKHYTVTGKVGDKPAGLVETVVELAAKPCPGDYVQPETDGPVFKVSSVCIRKEEVEIIVT